MDQIINFFNTFLTNITNRWSTLNTTQKGVFAAAFLLVAGGLGAVFVANNEQNMQYLFTDLSSEDASAISAFLEKNNYTDYVIDKKGVKVNAQDADRFRLLFKPRRSSI